MGGLDGGATTIEVTAGPAVPFYEKHGFVITGQVQTRFSLAVRLRKDLASPRPTP